LTVVGHIWGAAMAVTSTQTLAMEFRRVYATNVTANAYTARVDLTAAEFAAKFTAATNAGKYDTANGYIDLSIGQYKDSTPDLLKLKFYGTNANNETGNCRIYGVSLVSSASGTSYTHVLLGDYAFVLSSTCTGVAGGVVVATEYYADTITATTDVENVTDSIISPTGDVVAHLILDVKGFRYLLVEPIVGTAADVNVLVAGM